MGYGALVASEAIFHSCRAGVSVELILFHETFPQGNRLQGLRIAGIVCARPRAQAQAGQTERADSARGADVGDDFLEVIDAHPGVVRGRDPRTRWQSAFSQSQ